MPNIECPRPKWLCIGWVLSIEHSTLNIPGDPSVPLEFVEGRWDGFAKGWTKKMLTWNAELSIFSTLNTRV